MIGEVLKPGDVVVITIPAESRDWGHNPCPDGTRATVLGFSEITWGRVNNCCLRPGVYKNHSWTRIRRENDGVEYTEYTGRLALPDQNEYERRVELWQAERKPGGHDRSNRFLRELPETPLWEGDVIRYINPEKVPQMGDGAVQFVVRRIDYHQLGTKTTRGTPYPCYEISSSLRAGWYTSVAAEDVELVRRGKVWQFHNGQKPHFESVREEAEFFHLLGHYNEVRNPANGIYRWTREEILTAIADGIAHGMMMNGSLFGSGPSPSAIRFRNEKVGKRVAHMTLEGFGLAK